jgi:hypothetical protein
LQMSRQNPKRRDNLKIPGFSKKPGIWAGRLNPDIKPKISPENRPVDCVVV